MIPSPYNFALFGWLVVFCLFQIRSHYACLVGLEFLTYSSGCPPTHRHLFASSLGVDHYAWWLVLIEKKMYLLR